MISCWYFQSPDQLEACTAKLEESRLLVVNLQRKFHVLPDIRCLTFVDQRHHHHHHLFLKASIFPCVCPIWSPSTYSWIMHIQSAELAIPCHSSHILPTPSCPSPSCPSPYITTFATSTFFWPTPNHLHSPDAKPPQSTIPHHISHILEYPTPSNRLSILQWHSTHPSHHHHTLCPLQTMQIFNCHRPCFSPICQFIIYY